ncbi:MAG: hypothetical protein EZS28_042285, partial [Streblomastix strix]
NNIKLAEDQEYIIIDQNEFANIGFAGAVRSPLLIESPVGTSGVPNIYTLKLIDNFFYENVATNSGGIELVGNSYDLLVSSTRFYNNIGQQASDILVSASDLGTFRYQLGNTRSTPKQPDSISVKVGDQDLSPAIVNRETTFTVSDGSDGSVYPNSYLAIGEALYKAKLGNLDEEIVINLNPGIHTKDGLRTGSLTIGSIETIFSALPSDDYRFFYYPQKVAILGIDTRPTIVRSNANLFTLNVVNQGSLRLNNLHVTSNGIYFASTFITFQGEKLTIDDVEFVNNNLGTSTNLISATSFSEASITNCVFKNNIASRLISTTINSNAKLVLSGNTFANDEYQSSQSLQQSAVYITLFQTGDVKINDNTFKYLKTGASYAPVYFYLSSVSSTVKIEHNTFEDNTGSSTRAVRLTSFGTGQVEDIIFSNVIIKDRDIGAYIPAYRVGTTDYSYLIPEFINRRTVVKGAAPAGSIPEEVFASLPEAVGGLSNHGNQKLFINIVGGAEVHETTTIDTPLLNLEIVGVEHREDKLAKKDDQPQFQYEEVLRVQLNIKGSFNV